MRMRELVKTKSNKCKGKEQEDVGKIPRQGEKTSGMLNPAGERERKKEEYRWRFAPSTEGSEGEVRG